jgi:PAS domain S-box-containing protein
VKKGKAGRVRLDIEEQYAALTEALRDCAIYSLDSKGNIVSWSGGAESMKGYREAEVLGRNISLFYAPEDAGIGRHVRALKAAAKDGRFEDESWRVRKDGSRFWAHSIIVALHGADGQADGFFTVTRDLTERKLAQERFRLAVESAPNAMVMVNPDGKVVLVNSQTEKLFGYSRKELIGASVDILVPQPFRARHPDVRKQFFSEAQARPMGAGRDLFGLRKDGTQFPVEIGLNPIETDEGKMVLSSIVDITERRRAEQRFRLAVDSAPNAMVMVNQEGKIVLVNSQTEKLFGYSRDELIGRGRNTPHFAPNFSRARRRGPWEPEGICSGFARTARNFR